MSKQMKSGADDEMRRKFREALERKQGKGQDDHPDDPLAGKGPQHEAGAKTQRMFRRKSG